MILWDFLFSPDLWDILNMQHRISGFWNTFVSEAPLMTGKD